MRRLRIWIASFMAALLLYTSLLSSATHAAAPVVVAGAGVAAYVEAVVLTAGVVGVLGFDEYKREMLNHSDNVWNGAKQAVKDSIQASVDAAVAAKQWTVTLSSDVVNYFKGQQTNIVYQGMPYPRVFTPTVEYKANPVTTDVKPSWSSTPIKITTRYPAYFDYAGTYELDTTFDVTSPYVWYNTDAKTAYRTLVMYGNNYKSPWFADPVPEVSIYNPVSGQSIRADTYFNSRTIVKVEDLQELINDTPGLKGKVAVVPRSEALRLKQANDKLLGGEKIIGTPALPVSADGTMTIPIPFNDIIAHPVGQANVNLTWNPTRGIWELNGVPYSGAIDWTGPWPEVVELDGRKEVAVPVNGDRVIVSNPTRVVPGDTTAPTTADPWTNPSVPSNVRINFDPLIIAGNQLTGKFPFSIPWDIQKQLSIFNVQPMAPVIKIDYKIPVFNTTMNMKFDIDFSIFDKLAVVARWAGVIAFDVGLAMAVRRFLPE